MAPLLEEGQRAAWIRPEPPTTDLVDRQTVTIATTSDDPTVVVEGLPPGVDVHLVDGAGNPVDRPIRVSR